MLISPSPDQEENKPGSMSGTCTISKTSRRKLSLSSPPPLQGKAPKEIHAILTETLAWFLPRRAKDLSAPLYKIHYMDEGTSHCINMKAINRLYSLPELRALCTTAGCEGGVEADSPDFVPIRRKEV